jgi:hypothetical protein
VKEGKKWGNVKSLLTGSEAVTVRKTLPEKMVLGLGNSMLGMRLRSYLMMDC